MEIENQQSKKEPFQPWTVESGPWGGRSIAQQTGNQDLNAKPSETQESTIQKWVDSSEALPFSQHPPNLLLCSVQNLLVQDNTHHAKGNVQALLSQRDCSDNPPGSTEATSENREHHARWSVGPEKAWLQAPIASRPSVGRELLDRATLSMGNTSNASPHYQYCMDTWSSPFAVGYLNVERCHLVGSVPEIVVMVLRHRPDILFLGDLRHLSGSYWPTEKTAGK